MLGKSADMIVERTELAQLDDFEQAIDMLKSATGGSIAIDKDGLSFMLPLDGYIRLSRDEWQRLLEYARLGYRAATR